ncbi:alpha/beta hydrolase [Candidatus Parcubacteria bacterium]|nr:MAG: alpha/beta hydrolase [Candidatus Parcubacteria bacterium]
MRTIVNNRAVEYSDEGTGPAILMLHGWADNLHTFDAIVQELPGFRIVRLDMPGFGQSERPNETWGVVEYARFVEDFIKKVQIDPQALIGHSFGGRVIIKGVGVGIFAPQKIVLIASAGVARKTTLKSIVLRVIAKIGKVLTLIPPFSLYRQQIRKKLYGALGSDYFAAGSMRDVFLKVVREDLIEYARQIRIPALLIWGRRDSSTPLSDGEKIRDAIRQSEMQIIEGASHFVHQEKPREVAQLIREFI